VVPALAYLTHCDIDSMLTIIGCGNLNRSDDGVGVVVARRLMHYREGNSSAQVSVFDAGTGGMDVMFRARGATRLILIDASRSGSEPGAVFRVPGEELARDYQPTFSLHDFRWDHALYAGRRIFGASFPADITVFLIEAATLVLGTQLSEAVQHAADRVVTEIAGLVEDYFVQVGAPRALGARIARGSIYLDRALCAQYLGDAVSVAVLQRDGRSLLVPLHGSTAGGLLLKVLNARGDRVVHAEEFLRTVGIEADAPERRVPVRWCPEVAALILDGLEPTAN
jgi:hydrogenase maturation protease